MIGNRIDVLLPVPLYVAPNIAENYKERHIASDWEYLMEYFKKKLSKEYEVAEQIFSGNLYYPCNMFIARKEVLDQLCEWMFPILFCSGEAWGRKERFLSESLSWLYLRAADYLFL